jgi:sugar/nucleoside kinase (ribokinase family)
MPENSPPPERRYDIVTFGDLCVDLIMSGADVVPEFGQVEKLVEDYTLEMGGSCSIFACQAARLSMRTALLGRVGRDIMGDLMIHRMREAGVDTSHVIIDPSYKTGLGVSLVKTDTHLPGSDRAILTYPGALDAIEPEDIPDTFLPSARHLHHGSYYLHNRLRPHIPIIFQQARSLGLTISLDTNWDPQAKWGQGLDQVLPQVDVFFPNEQEALRISGTENVIEAGRHLQKLGIPLVAIKRGEQGAMLFSPSGMIECHVEPAPPGGDSIGAGDSFDAGFLAAWLRGLPLDICLKVGCLCGRAVASARGGVIGQPKWEVIQ